jgi:dipeptidyl aminopeptidase/acylaminoacyl peptidase
MGGGIALRVLVTSGQVESAVLYGAMSGDEQRNFEKIVSWSNGADGGSELETPLEALPSISPINYLGQITARISVHHGAQDTVVPPEWSSELCQQLQLLLKPVECFIYPGQPHNFTGASNQLLIERAIAFFQAAP